MPSTVALLVLVVGVFVRVNVAEDTTNTRVAVIRSSPGGTYTAFRLAGGDLWQTQDKPNAW